MQIFYQAIAFLGGLAMFLYGMQVMGDGLKSMSGTAMKNALSKVTAKPALGFLLGMIVACIIQSSTATIVITVGLVGAGLLTFHQSIGIVLGANVGTAITAQIIRLMDVSSGTDSPLYFFKADNLAPLALIIGIILIMFVRSGSSKNSGAIACGFGVLFMGLIYMSDVVSGFGDSLSHLLTAFENNYFLGFLAGVGVTGVVQSSSAVVGIIQSIASSVGVTFKGIFAVVIGVNIGDCITTYLVSRIGAKSNQRRTAVVHVIYNLFAAALCVLIVVIGRMSGIIDEDMWMQTLNSGGVANLHGFFRLVPAVLLLPLTSLFEKITVNLVPEEPVHEEDVNALAALDALDERLFNSPALALDQVRRVILEMSAIALHNFDACVKQIYEYDPERDARIEQRENLLDAMTDSANKYVVALSPHVTLERDTREQNYLLKLLICYERIGDLAVNIANDIATMRSENESFSANGMAELRIAINADYEILELATKAFSENDMHLARQVEPLEEVIDDLIEDMNGRHVYRMVNQLCNPIRGIYFQSILTNLEHVSDKCSDIAVHLLGSEDDSIIGSEHNYVHELHHSNNEDYMNMYKADYKKYFDNLNEIPVATAIEEAKPVASSNESKKTNQKKKEKPKK